MKVFARPEASLELGPLITWYDVEKHPLWRALVRAVGEPKAVKVLLSALRIPGCEDDQCRWCQAEAVRERLAALEVACAVVMTKRIPERDEIFSTLHDAFMREMAESAAENLQRRFLYRPSNDIVPLLTSIDLLIAEVPHYDFGRRFWRRHAEPVRTPHVVSINEQDYVFRLQA